MMTAPTLKQALQQSLLKCGFRHRYNSVAARLPDLIERLAAYGYEIRAVEPKLTTAQFIESVYGKAPLLDNVPLFRNEQGET